MSAGVYDLKIEQGATFTRIFTWQTGTPPAPVDVTGFSAHAQIRTASIEDGGVVLVDLTVGSGLALGGTLGTITVTISATQTTALMAGLQYDGEWDLKMTAPDGITVTRLLQGKVQVAAAVTA